jgi:DNA-binding response OmpR family regulator
MALVWKAPLRIACKQRCGLSITRTVRELQPLRRLHILFVDSDPGGRDRIQQALEDGFVVQCVASASDARRSLEAHLPDILICEVSLGSESGLDFCRSVRNTPEFQHLPIMLLTSLATFQDKVVGFHAGADDYVVKPFDTRHLMARIRLLSRIKRLEQRDNK